MRLRRADCSGSGVSRVRHGRGFRYVDESGERVTDPDVLARIDALSIPPAWDEVWICPYPNGHIQATGTDAAGRRQYRYHDEWRKSRDREKHERILDFARRLPRARRRVETDLHRPGLTRLRVLAAAVRLLDLGFFRIGGEEYAEANESFGLATIRKEHVSVGRDGVITFDYPAKSGQRRVLSIAEPDVYRAVGALKRRRGGDDELLGYRDRGGWHDIRSEEINGYIAEVLAGQFSAKDFRTWHATVLCAVALAVSTNAPSSEAARKRAVSRAVKETAHYLGNTPAVCRASYIDPRIIDAYNDGFTIRDDLDRLGVDTAEGELATQGPIERAVLRLLDNPPASRRRRAA